MDLSGKSFCPYCMSPVEDGEICPVCGLTKGAYQPSPHHLPPGTILSGRYLIGRVLGEGGFGITYIGCDLRLEMKVAIKEYFPADHVTRNADTSLAVVRHTSGNGQSYEKGVKRFLVEARTLARMEKQPEIVTVRDYFEANDTAYIVMEYVDGTNFNELVKQRGSAIPPEELFPMIEPLFSALAIVHKTGLLHRDISPDNLMLEQGKIRLLDFGCAREATSGNETLTIAIKQGYGPIEQYQERGQGPWTDVYALSATIYFCLTGRKPPQALDRTLDDELIPPGSLGVAITPEQEAALMKGLAVNPKMRWQSVEELHAGLYGSPEGKPLPSKPERKKQSSEPEGKKQSSEPEKKPLPSEPEGKEQSPEPEEKPLPSEPEGEPIPQEVFTEGEAPVSEESPEKIGKAAKGEKGVKAGKGAKAGKGVKDGKKPRNSLRKRIIAGIGTAAAIALLVIAGVWLGSREAAVTASSFQEALTVSTVSELMDALSDDSVSSVIWDADGSEWTCDALSCEILSLTKPLMIAEGTDVVSAVSVEISGSGVLYVGSGAQMEFTTTGIITNDGGRVVVERDGTITGVSLLFTEKDSDVKVRDGGSFNAGQTVTVSEEKLFAGAVHVTTFDEMCSALECADAIVIDATIYIDENTESDENAYADFSHTNVLISEDGALAFRSVDAAGSDRAVLLGSGYYLINRGKIELDVFQNRSSGTVINYGTMGDYYSDSDYAGDASTLINLGSIMITGGYDATNANSYWYSVHIYNYGYMEVEGAELGYYAVLYNSGTINLTGRIAYVGGTLEDYGQLLK